MVGNQYKIIVRFNLCLTPLPLIICGFSPLVNISCGSQPLPWIIYCCSSKWSIHWSMIFCEMSPSSRIIYGRPGSSGLYVTPGDHLLLPIATLCQGLCGQLDQGSSAIAVLHYFKLTVFWPQSPVIICGCRCEIPVVALVYPWLPWCAQGGHGERRS